MDPVTRRRKANVGATLTLGLLTAVSVGWCITAFMLDAWWIVKVASCGVVLLLAAVTLSGVSSTLDEWDLPDDGAALFAWQADQMLAMHQMESMRRDESFRSSLEAKKRSRPEVVSSSPSGILEDLDDMRKRHERLKSGRT